MGVGVFGLGGFTSLDSKEGFDEASKKIREAMRERGEMRRRKSQAEQRGMVLGESDESGGETAGG